MELSRLKVNNHPCGSVSCRGCGFAASAASCRRLPARTSRTARSFPAYRLGSRKGKAPSGGSSLCPASSVAARRGRRACSPIPPCPHSPGRRCSPSVRSCAGCPPSSPCPAGRRRLSKFNLPILQGFGSLHALNVHPFLPSSFQRGFPEHLRCRASAGQTNP